jgi:hypothetical protein
LVKDVEEAEKSMPADLVRNPVKRFEAEGTKEQYLTSDADHSGAILLMQPIGDGPYKRAMAKRGPGLHHICIKVGSLSKFIAEIANSGFLLHPYSLESMKHGTAYFCRPGIGFLLEVEEYENDDDLKKPSIFKTIILELGSKELNICKAVFADLIVPGSPGQLKIKTREEQTFLL